MCEREREVREGMVAVVRCRQVGERKGKGKGRGERSMQYTDGVKRGVGGGGGEAGGVKVTTHLPITTPSPLTPTETHNHHHHSPSNHGVCRMENTGATVPVFLL